MSLPANATFVQAFLRISCLVIPPLQTSILLFLYPKPKYNYNYICRDFYSYDYKFSVWRPTRYCGNPRVQYIDRGPAFSNPLVRFIPLQAHRSTCSGCHGCWSILNLNRLRIK